MIGTRHEHVDGTRDLRRGRAGVRQAMSGRQKFVVAWTFVVCVSWIVLAIVLGGDCSPHDFFCFDSGDLFVLFAPFALAAWIIGLGLTFGLLWIHNRRRRDRQNGSS